jgi:predicted MFS family arabinose efflux permease
MGMHEAVYGVGMCVGPLVGGAIADTYGPSVLYMVLAVVAVTLMPLAVALGNNSQSKPGKSSDVG